MMPKTFGAVTTSARCTCTPPVVYEPRRDARPQAPTQISPDRSHNWHAGASRWSGRDLAR
jgi:hypothetical protein